MKKKNFFLVAFIVLATSVFAQMSTPDNNKVRALDKEINRLEKVIGDRNKEMVNLSDYSTLIKKEQVSLDSLRALDPKTAYGLKLKDKAVKDKSDFLNALVKKQNKFESESWKFKEIKSLSAQLVEYKSDREVIFQNYIADSGTQKELGCVQTKRLFRGLAVRHADRIETNEARREELTFDKLKQNPVYGDSLGLSVIIANKYWMPITFQFTPMDGGESKSILVYPGKVIKKMFVPGKYLVSYLNGGREICESRQVTVNAVINDYNGMDCHAFVYMPSR